MLPHLSGTMTVQGFLNFVLIGKFHSFDKKF